MPADTIMTAEPARAQLRSNLAAYFRCQPVAEGHQTWGGASQLETPQQNKLLVGDPVTLMVSPRPLHAHPKHKTDPARLQENLKILRQYTKLLSQACHGQDPLTAHAQPLSPSPTTYPRNLQWFEHLAKPYQGLDEFGVSRITELLRLHAACDKSVPALPRQQAYELAKSLPHFDRDLTAYYLSLPVHAREYELHVAHSIMRLHNPSTLEELHHNLGTWRNQGLLHVLSVAALNMPDLADWWPVLDKNKDTDACSLHECLRALHTAPRDYSRTIRDFILTQDPATPTAQAIAATLDRLAILMSVKSNAAQEPDHDLEAALRAFPHLESLEPQDVWTRIKPALVRSLPPSVLRVDPVCAKKRAKQVKGTW
jgi:hypothetical protein